MITLGALKIPSSVSNAMCLGRWLVGQRLMWDFLSRSAPSSALGPPFACPSQRSGSMLSFPKVLVSYLQLKTFEPGEDSGHCPGYCVPRAVSGGQHLFSLLLQEWGFYSRSSLLQLSNGNFRAPAFTHVSETKTHLYHIPRDPWCHGQPQFCLFSWFSCGCSYPEKLVTAGNCLK